MATRRPQREQQHITLTERHIEVTASLGAAQKFWKNKTGRQCRVKSVQYHNLTGLATHADNWFVIALKQGSVVVADWSTDTGEEGTIAADTHVSLTLSATAADLIIEPDEVLSLMLTEGGTATLPAGQIEVTLLQL